jgi:hypothetical protein
LSRIKFRLTKVGHSKEGRMKILLQKKVGYFRWFNLIRFIDKEQGKKIRLTKVSEVEE